MGGLKGLDLVRHMQVEATLPHLVLQNNKNDTEKRSNGDGVREKE